MFGDLLQGMLRRQVVEAHGSHWLVCVDLGCLDEKGDARGDRLALAVPCDAEGRIELPSPPAQIIRRGGL